MTREVKILDEAERQQMETQADRILDTPTPPPVDARSGREFVFVAHFDGTLNDKDNLRKGELQTNVANLYDLMKPLAEENENFVSHYERGVGTGNSGLRRLIKASIRPSGDMRSAAQNAYDEFREKAIEWLRDHPNADPATSLKVMATGFSRGGVTMAIFSQMLCEEGLVADDGKILIEPGVLGLSGGIVYDPVSKSYNGNAAFSPTSRNITEIQATAEYRKWFKDVDHGGNPNVSTVEVLGNHSNIGGSYDRGISARILDPSREWFAKAGVPINQIHEEMRYQADNVKVYEEYKPPWVEKVQEISGSKVLNGAAAAARLGGQIGNGAMLAPQGIKWLAGRIKQPRTHDPGDGLDAPRGQVSSAREPELMADGWQRFESANGVVWSKDYSGSNQWNITRAVMVERDLPGRNNDRIDMYQIHGNGQVDHYQQHIAAGRKMQRLGAESRQRADQAFNPSPDQRLNQESLQIRENKADQHLQQKVERRLEQRLQQQDRNRQEIKADEPSATPPVPGDQAASNKPRQATVAAPSAQVAAAQRNKEMARTFKADPATALEQYPDNQRISAAKATLDEVRQRLPKEGVAVKRLHNELVNRLARGAAIPNPQQAFGMIHRAMGRGGIGG